MLSIFEIASLLLALSAFFGWLNDVTIKLPHTIGLLVFSLLASLSLLLAQYLVQLQCKYPYDMILLWLVHVLVWGRGYLYLQDDVTLSRWLIEHHVPRLSVFYGNSM